MYADNPEQITTRIKTLKDRNLSIILDQGRFMDMNHAYTVEMGQSLIDVAESDPVEAYRYIRRAIGQSAALNTLTLVQDKQVMDIKTDGVEPTRSLAEETVLKILPPEYEAPKVVYVSIQSVRDDSREVMSEPLPLMELQIEPPSLAA